MLRGLLIRQLNHLLILHHALEQTKELTGVAHPLEQPLELRRQCLVRILVVVLDDTGAVLDDFAEFVSAFGLVHEGDELIHLLL